VRAEQGVNSDELKIVAVVAHDGLDEELVAHHALPGQLVALPEHAGAGEGGKEGGKEVGRRGGKEGGKEGGKGQCARFHGNL